MSYLIKQVASPESGKINKGVFAIDLDGLTSSGMFSGITPPSGSVVVIGEGANNDPDFWIIKRGQDLINFGVYTLGLNGSSTEADVLGYIGSQNSFEMLDKMPLPPLSDEILHFDFSSLMSYPRTLDRTYNLGISTNPYTQLVNSPTFSTRGYMSWDGVDDYSRVNGNVEGSEEFVTITTLVRRGNDGLNGGLFGFGNDAGSTQDIYYWGGDGSRQFGFNTWHGDSWGFVAANQPGEIMDGNWHHLTAMWNRNDIFDSQIFVDGIPKDLTQVRGTTQNRTVSQQFGIAHNGWHVSDQLFRGDMQYLRQYNRILGEDEILKDYYQSNIVLNGLATYIDADHLVSYESLQGSDINDLTKTTSATLNNATHDGDAKTFLLDGTDDFIIINDPNLTNTEASVEVWFKMNDFNISYGGRTYLVDPRGNGGTGGTSMYFLFDYVGGTYNNTVHFVSGCGNAEIQSPNLYLARDVWHHAVSTIDANANTTIYLDGKVIAQGTANPTNLTFSNAYRVGTYANTPGGTAYMLNGEIAQYRMYTRKITPDEVLQNYRAHAHKFEHNLGTPALPAKNAKYIMWANPEAESGVYWIKPEGYNGEAFPVYCDMDTDNGGWMHVGTIYDGNEGHTDTSAHPWSLLNPTQDTGIWEDSSTLDGPHPRFDKDYKNEGWNNLPFTQMLIKDSGATQRNLLYTNTGQIVENNDSLSSWFGSLEWLTNGSETSLSAVNNSRVTVLDITNFGVSDPILDSGNKTKLLFKFGERDGVQDANKDRSMIAWHRHDQNDNVDAPAGIGNFTNRSGNIDFRDIQPYAQRSDFPDNSITGAPYSVSIWVR